MEEKVSLEKKTVNKKVIIGVVAAIVVIVLAIVLVLAFKGKDEGTANNETGKEGPVANTQAEIVKEFEINGLRFSNIAVITEGTTSYLTMDVTNPTNNLIKMKSVDIVMKDKDGNVLTTLLGYFGGEVPAGETRTISSQAEIDLTKAVTKEVTITKDKQ